MAIAPAPPPAGISVRETWSARVVNFAALVAAASKTPAYLALLTANQTALDQQARSLKERMNVPGVEPVRTKGIAAGRR